MIACIALVIFFKESSKLASAYGIAVTGTMIVTSILFYFVVRQIWKWSQWASLSLVGGFLSIELSFFLANISKLHHGAWIPILIATGIFTIMTTWKQGRDLLSRLARKNAVDLQTFIHGVQEKNPHRVPGMAIVMTLNTDVAPAVLIQHYKHNRVLHELVVLLSVSTSHDPEIPDEKRVLVQRAGEGFYQVAALYGFMEAPTIHDVLKLAESRGMPPIKNGGDLSFYLGRETLVLSDAPTLSQWRKRLFIVLSRNARSATEFFHLPPDRVIEIGSQVRI
jgi:KUP system potassium uptake protein